MQRRPLSELLSATDAWPEMQAWIDRATNPVEVLPGDRRAGTEALHAVQITSTSPLGAIALSTGGLLVDHGWIRLLGAGHPRIAGSLATWNPNPPGAVFVGYDVLGGFFAINLGAMPLPIGRMMYFAPDKLAWEDLKGEYWQVLQWAFTGDIEAFYAGLRWDGWRVDVERLGGEDAFAFQPPLDVPGMPIAQRQRRVVAVGKLWVDNLMRARR